MTQELRVNGNGVPRVYLKPTNEMERFALEFLQEAAGHGQTVTLTAEDDATVLTVKEGK